MKYLLISLLFFSTAYAGTRTYGPIIVQSVRYRGEVTLQGTKVLGPLDVKGRLFAKQAILNKVKVDGPVILDHCEVNGPSNIDGNMMASTTQFKQDITIAGTKIILDHCVITNLRVRRTPPYKGTQTVTLTNATSVQGNITFDSGKGTVRLLKGSTLPNDPGVPVVPY